METIEAYFDTEGIRNGRRGCYRARLASNHGIHAAGASKDEAIRDLLRAASSHGLSGSRDDYTLVNIQDPRN